MTVCVGVAVPSMLDDVVDMESNRIESINSNSFPMLVGLML